MIAMPKIARAFKKANGLVGSPLSRVDGPAKVTGAAKYAGEFNTPGLTYGYVVSSAITYGKITSIDTTRALRLPGVLHVFSHENRPNLAWFDKKWKDDDSPARLAVSPPLRRTYSLRHATHRAGRR